MTYRHAALALLLGSVACTEPAPAANSPRLVERVHTKMGSELRLTAWTADEAAAVSAFDEVFREFDRLDGLMSVWREGSDVVRLNASRGARRAGEPGVCDTLLVARQVSEWTGGKFDVTFGALSGLWKFDHDQNNRIPDPAAVRARPPAHRLSRPARGRDAS